MKIFFISPRPFGLMGTPGTYHLVEAYHKLATISMVASARRDANVEIVHPRPEGLDVHEVNFGKGDYAAQIARMAKAFDPDIVCITNCHTWYEVIDHVKREVPRAKYVLDIKSPLVMDATSPKKAALQQRGAEHAHLVDMVATRCTEDVESWIPGCDRPVFIYPLGVKLSQFKPRRRKGQRLQCRRFVFIGSYSRNRKLGKLLEYVARLPETTRSAISLDMYGSGPEKEKLQEEVARLGLEGVVHVYDGKPQDELLALLPEYDAGIGWVPKEIYDAAPSLKVLEYIGSGLVPIMTSTQGHRRNLEEGFKAITFDESGASFRAAMDLAVRKGFLVADLEHNVELISGRDWDHVARDYLLPAFQLLKDGNLKELLARQGSAGAPVANAVVASAAPGVGGPSTQAPPTVAGKQRHRTAASETQAQTQTQAPAPAVPLRILMISPAPFGQLGTPGTYRLAEAYARHVETCVIAAAEESQTVPAVHQASRKLRLHKISFEQEGYLADILEVASRFRPTVVWLGNGDRWRDIAGHLRQHLPHVKIVLDVESPLRAGDGMARRKETHAAGVLRLSAPDLVVARNAEEVQGSIPGFAGPVSICPIGVPLEEFHWREPREDQVLARRLVYIGSYSRSRNLGRLLQLVAGLSPDVREQITLDMYGDGPDRDRLKQLVHSLGLGGLVTIHPALPQAELFRVLPEYHAGIAWAPREMYDTATPVSTLEFIGTGLVPLAADSVAHRRQGDEGFELVTFDEHQASFERAVAQVSTCGFDAARVRRNRQLLENRSFDSIVVKRHLPTYRALMQGQSLPEPGVGQPAPSGKRSEKSQAMAQEPVELPIETASQQMRSLDRVLVWAPGVEPFRPTPQAEATRLRIGFVGSDRLYAGLKEEADLALLQPGSWRASLKHGRFDLLLVESGWITATGDWYMAQSARGEVREELESLVRLAKDLGIPTAYWMTLDTQYVPLYDEFMRGFDRIFCADFLAVQSLERRGVQAAWLPPAVQPRHFNPITVLNTFNHLQPGFVYDGWADMFRYHDHHAVLKELGPENLTIIDTSCMMAKLQLERTHEPALKPAIRGWVPRQLLPEVYKRSVAYLSFQDSHVTPTQASWAMLEAAACRLAPLHHGRLAARDFRAGLAQQCEDSAAFVATAKQVAKDDLVRERAAQKAWRTAHAHHTYRHRLAEICSQLGIRGGPASAAPKATLVTGTMRQHLLEKCIAQYEEQTHANKELILVFNGAPEAVASLKDRYARRPDIHIAAIPTDHFAGVLLNYGVANSTGDYFFRVDDDDHYGSNYIADCLLYLQAYDADILGKRASFFHFEGEDAVHLRKGFLPEVSSFAARRLHESDRTLISGCSFAARMDLLRSIRYPDHVNLSADTELVDSIRKQRPDARCLIVDNMNLVVERFSDVRKHTWQQTANSLKQTSSAICRDVSEIMT